MDSAPNTSGQMKVVLLVLSGDPNNAYDKVQSLYPSATIETISRADIENRTMASRLKTLRARQPRVFAIATERLGWQRGQNLFMLFGALAGARHVVMFDAHGALVRRSRATLLLGAPAKLGKEALLGAKIFSRVKRDLQRLETEVEARAHSNSTKQVFSERDNPRVVYLRATPGPGTQAGGAASHIKGVVEALSGLGADVSVISNDRIAGLNELTSKLTVIEPQSLGGTRALFDIQNNFVFTKGSLPIIEAQQPDFIYQRYARFGWAGVVASLRTGRPLFLEYNGSEVWVGRYWDHVGRLDLLARYELLNLKAATRIFVVSDVERRNLERSGIEPAKIIVNPNGVDTDEFRPGIGGEERRKELGINDNEVLVGFVGSFGPWHGVMVLAEAIQQVAADTGLRFLLVGTGSLHARMETALESQVKEGRAIFTGAVKHHEVPALLDACDILVAPHVPLTDGSEFFGSPTKLFEYMAMGKGIVASRLGQIGEVLTDEQSALLVEPGDATQLAQAIQRLAASDELRLKLGRQARATAVENFTWKHNAQRVLGAYSEWTREA